MADTWSQRDLPVLRAIVDLFEEQQRSNVRARDIENRTGFDSETVQKAISNLYAEPFLSEEGRSQSQSGTTFVGRPNGAALRAVGDWPTPDQVAARLVAALEEAAEDTDRPEEERSMLKRAALGVAGVGYQVVIAALANAGGNYLSS